MATTAVPDRGDDPKRKFHYGDNYRSGDVSYDRDLDSGISKDYISRLDEELKRRPGKFGK